MKPIVFFDGVCVLCNSVVNFLLHVDKKHVLTFAPLQGSTAKQFKAQQLGTIVFYHQQNLFYKSQALIQIGKHLGGGFKLLASIAQIIPKFLADWLYDRVATNRYKIFGKYPTCRLPSAEEKDVFLD